VLYEVIAGRHPLADLTGHGLLKGLQRAAIPDIRGVRPDCPPAIAEFLQDALAADPARRPRTAADLRAVLQSVLTPS
jgi:serine/threonine-protein kinase